jgi:hypothetical protein
MARSVRAYRWVAISLPVALVAAVVAGCLWAGLTKWFIGPTWVQTTVFNFLPHCNFFCIVAEDADGLRTMSWYGRLIFPIETPAADSGEAYRDPNSASDEPRFGHVIWRDGARYGVVQREVGGKWFITWLKVEPPGRGKEIVLDLAKGQTEALAPAQVEALGLSQITDFPLKARAKELEKE